MQNKTFYNEILTEHNLHSEHKHVLDDANLVLEGVNLSCRRCWMRKISIYKFIILCYSHSQTRALTYRRPCFFLMKNMLKSS